MILPAKHNLKNIFKCCPHPAAYFFSPLSLTKTSILPHLCHLPQESELDSNRQPDSPSEEEPLTPRPVSASQNPKYQLFLSNDLKTNGVSGKDADGPGGGGSLGENGPNRLSRWETNRLAIHQGSSESLASRDMDSAADRVGDVGAAGSRHALVTQPQYSQCYLLMIPTELAVVPQGKPIIQCHLVDKPSCHIQLRTVVVVVVLQTGLSLQGLETLPTSNTIKSEKNFAVV